MTKGNPHMKDFLVQVNTYKRSNVDAAVIYEALKKAGIKASVTLLPREEALNLFGTAVKE